jgi:antitoxin MazE
MIKHLTTHGNSLALIIEKAILELLHITQDTPLEINTDGRNLVISPVEDEKREKQVSAALAKINKKYARTLKALAG